jgi:hypothetical protein
MLAKRTFFLGLIAIAVSSLSVSAQLPKSTTPQTLAVTVQKIDSVSVSGAPTITLATAGTAVSATGTAPSLYFATNSDTARKVVVKMNSVTSELTITLSAAVTNIDAAVAATGSGPIVLDATDKDLVSGIVSGSGNAALDYKASGTLKLKPGDYSKTVTYTLMLQ